MTKKVFDYKNKGNKYIIVDRTRYKLNVCSVEGVSNLDITVGLLEYTSGVGTGEKYKNIWRTGKLLIRNNQHIIKIRLNNKYIYFNLITGEEVSGHDTIHS